LRKNKKPVIWTYGFLRFFKPKNLAFSNQFSSPGTKRSAAVQQLSIDAGEQDASSTRWYLCPSDVSHRTELSTNNECEDCTWTIRVHLLWCCSRTICTPGGEGRQVR